MNNFKENLRVRYLNNKLMHNKQFLKKRFKIYYKKLYKYN